MIAPVNPVRRVVLYEGLGSHPLDSEFRSTLLKRLLDQGFTVSRVTTHGSLAPFGRDQLTVLGRFLEDVPPLNVASDQGHVAMIQVEGLSQEEILDRCRHASESTEAAESGAPSAPTKTWKPWFPVIDYDRCTNCMQCLSFCLFDVYGVSGQGKIQVQNESHCKTDCPACSRVCPEVAILFPKYKSGPINGDEVNQDDIRREGMKVDISALLGGDIYSMLRDRSIKAKSRFSKERDEDRALKERLRCLNKLKGGLAEALDIPEEVMASLPNLDQIQEKAQRARELAQNSVAPQTPNS